MGSSSTFSFAHCCNDACRNQGTPGHYCLCRCCINSMIHDNTYFLLKKICRKIMKDFVRQQCRETYTVFDGGNSINVHRTSSDKYGYGQIQKIRRSYSVSDGDLLGKQRDNTVKRNVYTRRDVTGSSDDVNYDRFRNERGLKGRKRFSDERDENRFDERHLKGKKRTGDVKDELYRDQKELKGKRRSDLNVYVGRDERDAKGRKKLIEEKDSNRLDKDKKKAKRREREESYSDDTEQKIKRKSRDEKGSRNKKENDRALSSSRNKPFERSYDNQDSRDIKSKKGRSDEKMPKSKKAPGAEKRDNSIDEMKGKKGTKAAGAKKRDSYIAEMKSKKGIIDEKTAKSKKGASADNRDSYTAEIRDKKLAGGEKMSKNRKAPSGENRDSYIGKKKGKDKRNSYDSDHKLRSPKENKEKSSKSKSKRNLSEDDSDYVFQHPREKHDKSKQSKSKRKLSEDYSDHKLRGSKEKGEKSGTKQSKMQRSEVKTALPIIRNLRKKARNGESIEPENYRYSSYSTGKKKEQLHKYAPTSQSIIPKGKSTARGKVRRSPSKQLSDSIIGNVRKSKSTSKQQKLYSSKSMFVRTSGRFSTETRLDEIRPCDYLRANMEHRDLMNECVCVCPTGCYNQCACPCPPCVCRL